MKLELILEHPEVLTDEPVEAAGQLYAPETICTTASSSRSQCDHCGVSQDVKRAAFRQYNKRSAPKKLYAACGSRGCTNPHHLTNRNPARLIRACRKVLP